MSLPDITNKRFVIFGLQGSGKTELAKQYLRSFPVNQYVVYDVHHEYNGFTRYLAANRQVDRRNDKDPGIAELDGIVDQVVIKSGKVASLSWMRLIGSAPIITLSRPLYWC